MYCVFFLTLIGHLTSIGQGFDLKIDTLIIEDLVNSDMEFVDPSNEGPYVKLYCQITNNFEEAKALKPSEAKFKINLVKTN